MSKETQANEIHTIDANGLTFAYHTMGQGPLLLCVHGFPDNAESWLPLMPELAAAGYQVVAPYTRGYAPTQIPAVHQYSALDLGADIVALIHAFGVEKAAVIGHDWGALAAYTAANLAPEAISKLVTVAIPHPRSIKPSLSLLWKSRHFITFQFKRLAAWQLKRNQAAYVESIYRRWSPTWDFSPGETQAIRQSFMEPGRAEAALGYYWSFAADGRGQRAKEVQAVTTKRTSVDTLCLVGDADGALDLGGMAHTPKAYTGSYRFEIFPNVGHFLHREDPQRFLKTVLAFLEKRQND